MKVFSTGVVFIGECEIRAPGCSAINPAPITAFKTDIVRTQINVCHNCLDAMVRDGQWEVSGAKIARRADLAVYDRAAHPQLVIEVKTSPQRPHANLRERATQIRRNLLVHSGVPNAPYLMVVYYPDKAYLWQRSDCMPAEAPPTTEIDMKDDLERWDTDAFGALSDFERSEAVVSSWLHHLITPNGTGTAIDTASNGWIRKSGLYDAIKDGRVEENARGVAMV